jgi:HD-GYP domain-containing protein (c-di-GMP phosphodiesterase class II)
MRLSSLGSTGLVVAACTAAPAAVLVAWGTRSVMPPRWVHFCGVGVTALVATAVAVALTTLGARRRDVRTVIVGGGFSLMAALLAVHGLTTPGVLIGPNGLIAVSGGLTLPVGGAVLALSALPRFAEPRAIGRVIALQLVLGLGIVVISVVCALDPKLVPGVPAARSPAAVALLALGLGIFGVLGLRAARTFLLTRRGADLAVVLGLALLAVALWAALMLTFMDLGWWLGHVFEVAGIAVVGGSLAYDLRRGRRSRPLAGDFRPAELVAEEEAFFGARVRALMVGLAEKDAPVEAHARRVASLAVEIGERLGLSASRLRSLAVGGLLHDIGKLAVPAWVLQKPGPLTPHEFELVKRHPQHGHDLLADLGGFDQNVRRLVLDHHERLDGRGYPRGLYADELDLPTRILTICDVYDALVSARVYREAWDDDRALAFLYEEAGRAFDPRCVESLVDVLSGAGEPVAADLRLAGAASLA